MSLKHLEMLLDSSSDVSKSLVKLLYLFKSNCLMPLRVYQQFSAAFSIKLFSLTTTLTLRDRFNSYVSFWFASHTSPTYPPPDTLSFRIVFFFFLSIFKRQKRKKSKITFLPWCINASHMVDVATSCWQYGNRINKKRASRCRM